MAFTMIVSRLEKSNCLLKSSVPKPWQVSLIKTLATAWAISKLTVQTGEPIPTYTLLNPVCLLWTWHFKHGICFPDWLFCNGLYKLWKMAGLKYNMTFLHINKIYCCVSCEHVAITLPSIEFNYFANMRKHHQKFFNPFNIANNKNLTLKLKRKLDWCLELIAVM